MDNNCKYTREDVWDYYSNSMSRMEEAEMQEHLLSCNICKKRLAEIRGLSAVLDDNDEAKPDEPVIPAIAAKKSGALKYIILAAAIAAIVALIFLLKPSGYSLDVDPGNNWGTGDSTGQDSSGVEEMKLDTIYLE